MAFHCYDYRILGEFLSFSIYFLNLLERLAEHWALFGVQRGLSKVVKRPIRVTAACISG